MKLKLLKVSLLMFIVASCANYKLHDNVQEETVGNNGKIDYRVYLFGDGGKPNISGNDLNLKALKSLLDKEGDNSSIIFLGDNIYQQGLPDEDHPDRQVMEKRIIAQMDAVKDFKGKVIFIPGNHDWAQGRKQGWQNVKNQEKFIEQYLDRGNIFLPDNGCPGPIEMELAEGIVLILIDSHWWLHQHEKPTLGSGDCEIASKAQMVVAIQDALRRNRDKKIIFAAHHPLYSYGHHGGRFRAKEHIFPLVQANKNLYIPLPIIGSIQPVVRRLFGNLQDISHPEYQEYKTLMEEEFSPFENIMYVSGHEHNLQYIPQNKQHYIVSGSGSKRSPVANGKKLRFGYGHKGFGSLTFYESGDVYLDFYVPDDNGNAVKVFTQWLFTKTYNKDEKKELVNSAVYTDSTVSASISNRYERGNFTRFLMGDNYREVWSKKVSFEVFDIDSTEGGLTILKRGGGQQTRSLRLETKDGRQFVLRSVEKYTEKAIPVYLQNTFAADVVQDQISASNPYGALAIPPLADAVGVYHTNPRLVYMPDDPRLGIYRDDLANGVFLFEERPENGNKNSPSFGKPDKIKSTPDVIEKIQDKQSHMVDQMFVLRSRLFDIFIGDWDRHDDQWRWAKFNTDSGDIYRPIPRDRDQVFFVNQGIVPGLAARRWAIWKIQNFEPRTPDVVGLSFNARFFDRTFLTEPELDDWLAMADTISTNITDAVIEEAMDRFPAEIKAIIGDQIGGILKERRKYMREMAEELYLSLAKEVDVVGTNNSEYFEVTRLDDEQVKVTVYDLGKHSREKKEVLYERTFKRSETKEIRLYGLKGDDVFNIKGDVSKSILIRVIGGGGDDAIDELSHVAGMGKKSIVYDKPKGMKVHSQGELKNMTFDEDDINQYDRTAFKYNMGMPMIGAGFNVDDGVFLGLGFTYTNHGFRKHPYKSRHKLRGRYAFLTGAYNFDYSSEFIGVIGPYNVELTADIYAPNYLANFFGLGNNTASIEDNLRYNRVRLSQTHYMAYITRYVNNRHYLKVGGGVQETDLDKNEFNTGRFITDFNLNGLDSSTVFKDKFYAVGHIAYQYDKTDSKIMPTTGTKFSFDYQLFRGLNDLSSDFKRIKADIKFFYTRSKMSRTTLALRFGGARNYGDYEFFQANTLSGYDNLRGFRRDRFSGTSTAYQNTEVRFKLGGVKSYFLRGSIGLLAFHDVGRVWLDGESSDQWHNGYGAGLWLAPFDMTIVNITQATSQDGEWTYVTFKYLF